MNRNSTLVALSLTLFAGLAHAEAGPAKDAPSEPPLHKAVRESLERLPYYGVFDILNYEVKDNGVVELSGFAFRDRLKKEAEDTVSRVAGVKSVVNRIEDLEWGVTDDEIRARVYLAIYRDAFLSRYGTSTDQALANGIGFGRPFGPFGVPGIGNPMFPGFNPAGDYAIHILVSRGEVILVGEVDSEGDRNLAAMKARAVFPVKKVFNELAVRGEKPKAAPPAPAPVKRGIIADADNDAS